MKKKIMMYVLLLSAIFFLVSHRAKAQDSTARSHTESALIDSLSKAYNEQETSKYERRKNSENLSDLKSEKKATKAKAKEAQRIENEANDAARESKIAYRQEKKAQRAREQADKQAKKAAKARTKSDKN
jgi:cell shape-determining protein MreC